MWVENIMKILLCWTGIDLQGRNCFEFGSRLGKMWLCESQTPTKEVKGRILFEVPVHNHDMVCGSFKVTTHI